MIKKMFLSLLILIVISFLNIGGCSSNGNDSNIVSPDEATVTFIPGGVIPEVGQTFSYVEGGTDRQTLDFFGLQGLLIELANNITTYNGEEDLRPVIVWIHGGGWINGSKADIFPIAIELAEAIGFHLISINYRLANDEMAPWPDIIEDVNAAIRWVKLNGEMLGIDTDVIVLAGFSAGAHLGALAATASDVADLQGTENLGPSTDVNAVISFFGIFDLGRDFSPDLQDLVFIQIPCAAPEDIDIIAFVIAEAVGLLIDDDNCTPVIDTSDPTSGCDQDKVNQSSPQFHVDSTDPPMFLAHGTNDCTVLRIQSIEMSDALTEAGVFNILHLTDGAGHDINTLDVTTADLIDFLEIALGVNEN